MSRGSKWCLSCRLKNDEQLIRQRIMEGEGCLPGRGQHVQMPWEGKKHTGPGGCSWGQEGAAGTVLRLEMKLKTGSHTVRLAAF